MVGDDKSAFRVCPMCEGKHGWWNCGPTWCTNNGCFFWHVSFGMFVFCVKV